MTLKFTPQQEQAINTKDVSVALAAGAGCGKTFVLTHRFLSYLDPEGDGDPLSRIVAITFTDRAAREMRQRIRQACRQALEECEERHVEFWLRILRGLENARITTIHSFCSGFLRRHAVDAGLDPQFGLLEPAFAEPLLIRQVNDVLLDQLEQRNPDAFNLVKEYGLEQASRLVKMMVDQRFKIETKQYELPEPEVMAEQWLDYYKNQFRPRMIEELFQSSQLDDIKSLLINNPCGAPKTEERRMILVRLLDNYNEWADPIEALKQLRANMSLAGCRANHWEDESTQEKLKVLYKAARDQIDPILKFEGWLEFDLGPVVELSQQLFRISIQATEAYENYKQDQGLLDFDDLLLITRKLLRESTSLRKLAAEGIQYLMVDEFQDTDPVQTDVVRFLCEQQLLHGKLFLVGDVKQSIYRFRRADPEVFLALRQEVPEKGRLPLSVNFRSQPEILRFVNVLFHDEVEQNYEPLQPHSSEQLTPVPAVEFLFADEREWGDDARAPDRRKTEADYIADRIRNLLQDETPRVRGTDPETGEKILRRTQPGDIVVLFRAMSNIALYEDSLRRAGIDYYLVGGRAFYAQQEVYDFINICRVLDDPTDEIALAGVLRSPFFGIDDDTIFTLKYRATGSSEEQSLFESFSAPPPEHLPTEQQQQLRHAARVLVELRQNKDRWPLVRLYQYLLDQTGYDASLLHEFMGARKVANLRKLIDMARQFDRSGLYTLSDFVVRLKTSLREQSQEELATTHPETSDVVRLMTIHQSKGLEFPIVIVADCSWEPKAPDATVAFHSELGPITVPPKKQGKSTENLARQMFLKEETWADAEEYKRLFYVATTRAADMLILSAAFDLRKQRLSPWLKLLGRKFRFDTGLLVGDHVLGQIAKPGLSLDEIPHVHVWKEKPPITLEPAEKAARRIALSEFESAIAAAEPVELPRILLPVEPGLEDQQVYSVSLVEQIVSRLFEGDEPMPEPDRSDADMPTVTTSVEQATTLGDIVHAVIERIPVDGEVDLVSEINRSCEQLRVPVKEEVRQRAHTCLTAFLNSDLRTHWQSARELHREIDFLLEWPLHTGGPTSSDESRPLISGQIDCLFQAADGRWQVWDYKTGIRSDKAYLLHHYKLQLTLYAAAVEQLLGEVPEKIELIHLGQRMTPIEYVLYPETVSELYRQVDQAIEFLRTPTAVAPN